MGFKWFKARMWMDRAPVQPSAVVGSYRSIQPFDDVPYIARTNGADSNGEQSALRPKSLPVPNEPAADSGKAGSRKATKSINGLNQTSGISKSLGNLTAVGTVATTMDLSREGAEEESHLSSVKATPKPTGKKPLADFRRRKVRAPMPNIEGKNNSARAEEIVTISGVKTLQDSDFDA